MAKRKRENIRPTFLLKLVLATVILNGTIFYVGFGRSQGTKRVGEPSPPYFSSEAAAQPLPPTLAPTQFANESVAAAYRSAKEIPAVLAQQPCLCHCQRLGHRNLLDCFTTTHGAGCATCIKEALFSLQEYRRGLTPQQIRDEILLERWKSLQISANN